MTRPTRRSQLVALALCALLTLAAPAARAQESLAYEGVVGLGAVVTSLVYSPLKVVYAAGGLVVSGLALAFTFDPEKAAPILRQTVGGDYVVTPAHLEGNRELHFFGA